MEIQSRKIQANGITQNVIVKGEGPLVLLCHGFPELSCSWRSQIDAIASAGYKVAAPDMRGYGETEAPPEIEDYTVFHLVGDMVALVNALEYDEAIIVGHDWGAAVAWQAALLRPDLFKAVATLSVPYVPRAPHKPLDIMRRRTEKFDQVFYQVWFQEPGVAEQAYESDVAKMQRGMFYTCSGEASDKEVWIPIWHKDIDPTAHFKSLDKSPSWLTEEEMNHYIETFSKNGYRGPLNWYRNIDLNWELNGPWEGAKVTIPALFMVGEKDLTLSFAKPAINTMKDHVPNLKKTVYIPDAGHWLQQEVPDIVNKELIEFLKGL